MKFGIGTLAGLLAGAWAPRAARLRLAPGSRQQPLVFARRSNAERVRVSRQARQPSPAFSTDGRICLSNNAAEGALRGIALGCPAWLFAGSDRGGERAAAVYTLIATAKLNGPIRELGSPTRAAPHHRSSRLPAARPAPLSWKHRQSSATAAAA
jgi:hypothetical protein